MAFSGDRMSFACVVCLRENKASFLEALVMPI